MPHSRAGSLPQGNAFQCGSEPAREGALDFTDKFPLCEPPETIKRPSGRSINCSRYVYVTVRRGISPRQGAITLLRYTLAARQSRHQKDAGN
nr:hypothetical protein FEE99_02220 [Pseudomonas sp. ef1]